MMKWIGIGLAAIILLAAGLVASRAGPKAANITSRWVCPCVFVEDRSVDYCMANLPVDVGAIVAAEADPTTRTVKASSMLVFQSTARHEPGLGCLMNPPGGVRQTGETPSS